MTRTYHHHIIQGSDEWLDLRAGIVTASEVHKILSPKTLKLADNATSRQYAAKLAAERILGAPIRGYVSPDMERGSLEEGLARAKYASHYGRTVSECGFVTLKLGEATLGYSPDGLVESETTKAVSRTIEIKSRRGDLQILSALENDGCPSEYLLQVQAGLLVTNCEECDFISYSGGLPMVVSVVRENPEIQAAITQAVQQVESIVLDMAYRFQDMARRYCWADTEPTIDPADDIQVSEEL